MTTHLLRIEGMTCGHCVRAVQTALESVPGVQGATVEIGSARVEADDSVPVGALVAAITAEDFVVVTPAT